MKRCHYTARAEFSGKGSFYLSLKTNLLPFCGSRSLSGRVIMTKTPFLTSLLPLVRLVSLSCYKKGETEVQSKMTTCPRLLRAATKSHALVPGRMLFWVPTRDLKKTNVTRFWSAAELRTSVRVHFFQRWSASHCLGGCFYQTGKGEATFLLPQSSPLLSIAQLTPIQAAQGVTELHYLWMLFCVVPLAPAQLVPSLFQQLPDHWGDRLKTKHGIQAGPH